MNELIALSTALSKKDFLDKLIQLPDDIFQNYKNQEILRALKELSNNHDNIDFALLLTHMQSKGKTLDNDYVEKLLQTDISLNPNDLIKKLKDAWSYRHITKNAGMLFEKTRKGEVHDIKEFINNINELLHPENDDSFGELFEFSDQDLGELYPPTDWVKTGIDVLDDAIMGAGKGQLITIAATPGQGKSTLAFQIACNLNSMFFSLEMTKKQLWAKYLSNVCNVQTFQIYKQQFNDEEKARIEIGKKMGKDLNVGVHQYKSNLFYILQCIKDGVKTGKNSAFIDYVQLITDAPGYNTNNQLEFTTRSLKLSAGQNQIPIFILSQLTKDVVKENRRPTSGDLRNSGSIHQDSDVVIFIWEKEGQTIITIDKCREGKLGDLVGVEFVKQYSRFECKKFVPSVNFDQYRTFE